MSEPSERVDVVYETVHRVVEGVAPDAEQDRRKIGKAGCRLLRKTVGLMIAGEEAMRRKVVAFVGDREVVEAQREDGRDHCSTTCSLTS